MEKIIISLGSNLGNREKNLNRALVSLSVYFKVLMSSSILETEPLEYLEQPKFLNQLVLVENSQFSAYDILRLLNSIERSLGRIRTVDKGPRIIDLDIISINNKCYKDDYLVLNHPAIYSRDYLTILKAQLA